MDPRRVAEIESDRFHDPEGRAGGKDIGGSEYPGVLLDRWEKMIQNVGGLLP